MRIETRFVTGWAVIGCLLAVAGSGGAQVNNDTCDLALLNGVSLVPGANSGLTNVGATSSGVVPTCASGVVPIGPGGTFTDVWYVFIPQNGCTVSFELAPGTGLILPVLAAFDATGYVGPGGCGSLPELGCSIGASLQVTVSAGTPVLVQVGDVLPGLAGNFTINVNTAFSLDITQPLGPGSLSLVNSCGTPNSLYFTALTLVPGAYPNGWFFGVDIGIPDIATEIAFGAPFFGSLDAAGTSSFAVPAGIPSGLTLYAVSVVLSSSTGVPTIASAPVSLTTT